MLENGGSCAGSVLSSRSRGGSKATNCGGSVKSSSLHKGGSSSIQGGGRHANGHFGGGMNQLQQHQQQQQQQQQQRFLPPRGISRGDAEIYGVQLDTHVDLTCRVNGIAKGNAYDLLVTPK